MTSAIYQIKCKVTGKSYVGSTINYNDRMRRHIQDLRRGANKARYLQSDFNEYGEENFEFTILDTPDELELGKVERYWIVKLNSVHPNGYNGSLGGEKGLRHTTLSEEAREKLSKRLKENPIMVGWTDEMKQAVSEKRKGQHLGVPKSEEHKRKLSESNRGKHKHDGLNNPKLKINEDIFIEIKKFIIELSSQGNTRAKIEEIISDKYDIGKITVGRIIRGKHFLSKVNGGGLTEWLK